MAFLCALVSICTHVRSTCSIPFSQPIHIHIWGDNTSHLSWIRTHRFDSPFHGYLLSLFTLLQIAFNVFVTEGYIPGVHNPLADAASRLHIPLIDTCLSHMVPNLCPSPGDASFPSPLLDPSPLHQLPSLSPSPAVPILPSFPQPNANSLPLSARVTPSSVLATAGFDQTNRHSFPLRFMQNMLNQAQNKSLSTSLCQAALHTIQALQSS